MPVIQDAYSVNVSNRFDLGYKNYGDSDNESDVAEDIDPLEQLKKLEEERAKEREQKKKLKEIAAKKAAKKGIHFKENKDANVPAKKEQTEPVKEGKTGGQKQNNQRAPRRQQTGDRKDNQVGDENRRPPRRRNDGPRRPPRERGEGDTFGEGRGEDKPAPYNRGGPQGPDSRPERRDRPERNERFRGGRGGYRGGNRGTYRNDGRDDRGKREFDRRSGSDRSGVRPTEKRDGGGPRNWGTPGNEIEEPTEAVNLSSEDIGNWADHVENEQSETKKEKSEGEGEEEKEEEEQEVEMTLDEWKAAQVMKKQEFNIRKPGEGEDSAKWKGLKLLHPSARSNDNQEPGLQEDNSRRGVQSKPQVEVDIRFTDMPMRGGRGGRGGRGRGGYRGNDRRSGGNRQANKGYNARSSQLPPDVLNEAEFPTLPAA
uniref:plasminogen activator inhibitor 1 RNA-binding protein n=1 Tax=Ciona intestinalis TaxID=7719 RepID=UPI0000521C5A|nr:plasminogen activator inhibitor 1 RNA-binding protein [Ciona intestinalis]|eukprot:XP_002126647.1 plasminogen activator inhibitor 1 RNA-binding protein [Ciona intestinalis]